MQPDAHHFCERLGFTASHAGFKLVPDETKRRGRGLRIPETRRESLSHDGKAPILRL